MIPYKFIDFIPKIKSETEKDNLHWQEGTMNGFYCIKKAHTLNISSYFDTESEIDTITFSITTNGKETPFNVTNETTSDFNKMRELYAAVKANANNVEDDIADFLS